VDCKELKKLRDQSKVYKSWPPLISMTYAKININYTEKIIKNVLIKTKNTKTEIVAIIISKDSENIQCPFYNYIYFYL